MSGFFINCFLGSDINYLSKKINSNFYDNNLMRIYFAQKLEFFVCSCCELLKNDFIQISNCRKGRVKSRPLVSGCVCTQVHTGGDHTGIP